jgi:hypothetical protein
MCWLVLMALPLPLYGDGSSVVPRAPLLSSILSLEGLVRHKLVCLVVRPSDDGKAWPRRRDLLVPLADLVSDTGSEGSRSNGGSGGCYSSLVLSFHMEYHAAYLTL